MTTPSPTFPIWSGAYPEPNFWHALCNHQMILFAGSGLSAGVINHRTGKPLPTWKSMLSDMAVLAVAQHLEGCDANWLATTLAQIERGGADLLVVGQRLRETLEQHGLLHGYLIDTFDRQYVSPIDNHYTLCQVPFRAVITTNYDTLIETAWRSQVIQMTDSFPELQTASNFVFKMHGQYDLDTTNIVMGIDDYYKRIHDSGAYRRFLLDLFNDYTLLFVGFGGDDPHVLGLLETTAKKRLAKRPHYFLIPDDTASRYKLREKERDLSLRFYQFSMEDRRYEQVGAFLRMLAEFRCEDLENRPVFE